MKNIKKILLITAMTMALGTSAFAASGFEFLLNLSGGINVTIPTKETEDLQAKGGLGGFAGLDAQIGYMFQVKEGFGISVLGELGYSWDDYNYHASGGRNIVGTFREEGFRMNGYFHNFKVGLLPKFNIGVGNGAIAIGIGGGVKIPLAGSLIFGYQEWDETTQKTVVPDAINVNRKDITDYFSPSVIGYMKVTFDYYLFFTDNIGMNFGFYLGGDFGPKAKNLKVGGDAFDFGLQLGFRFGPKA